MQAETGTTLLGKRKRSDSEVSSMHELSSDEEAAPISLKDLSKAQQTALVADSTAPSSKVESSSTRSRRNKVNKKEQYKRQVIIDQFGTFEYDKDPAAYKKARKRQQNRESAYRARSRKLTQIE